MLCRFKASCASVLLMGLGVGCQPVSQGPDTLPVTGLVTQGGTPIEGATVLFHPINKGEGIKTSYGETDSAGRFELQSNVSGTTYKPGAQAGEYLVSVEKQDRSQVYKTMAPPKDMLPPKYKDPATSGFTANVSADGENHLEFPLEK